MTCLTRIRTLLILFCFVFAFLERTQGLDHPHNGLRIRQLQPLPSLPISGTSQPSSATSSGTSSSASPSSTQSSTTPNTSSSTPPTSTSTSSTQSSSQTSSTSPPATSSIPSITPSTTPSATPPPDSTSLSTNSDGQTVTLVVPGSASPTSSSSGAANSDSTNNNNAGSSGLGTGSIIGLSVAGGIALIGVVAFFVWKLTRKRLSDFDDEAIKWPELNAHGQTPSYALPTNATGRSGIGLESSSEVDLTRNESTSGPYTASVSQHSGIDSTPELYAPGGDPYAVPPLPHLNPNIHQPYHDDPNAYGGQGGFYDPYRGPVPQTFNDAASIDSHGPNTSYHPAGGEAIPMSNLASGGAGRRSPGPQMIYDTAGRSTPLPSVTGRQSPGLGVAYGGAHGDGRGPSPALGAGRRSPGPGPAYGGQ